MWGGHFIWHFRIPRIFVKRRIVEGKAGYFLWLRSVQAWNFYIMLLTSCRFMVSWIGQFPSGVRILVGGSYLEESQGSTRVQIHNTGLILPCIFCRTNTGHFGPWIFFRTFHHLTPSQHISQETRWASTNCKPMKLLDCAECQVCQVSSLKTWYVGIL